MDEGNYKSIEENYYRIKIKPHDEVDICKCLPSYKCGANCINRRANIECSPITCPCGQYCRNTAIQNKDNIAEFLDLVQIENKGCGLLTRINIEKGKFIIEYVGEVVTNAEFQHRMKTIYDKETKHFGLCLENNKYVIDSYRMGNASRFINHSCNPNCTLEKFIVNGMTRMAVLAKRNIQQNEELTFNYDFHWYNPQNKQKCYCGEPNCKQFIIGLQRTDTNTKKNKFPKENVRSQRNVKRKPTTVCQGPKSKERKMNPNQFENVAKEIANVVKQKDFEIPMHWTLNKSKPIVQTVSLYSLYFQTYLHRRYESLYILSTRHMSRIKKRQGLPKKMLST